MLIEANRSVLLIVDVQSKLVPAIAGAEICIKRCRLLLEAARTLDIPIRASEHCPASVGVTISDLGDQLHPAEILSKVHFDGSAEPAFLEDLRALDRPTIVVGGMEAHVCVLQTVLGLKGRGFEPVLVADAVSSRANDSRECAVERMRGHGIDIVTTEMVIFEWLKLAGTAAFKRLLPMIKAGKVG